MLSWKFIASSMAWKSFRLWIGTPSSLDSLNNKVKTLQYARPISLLSICDIKKTTSGMKFYFFLNNGEISVVCMLHATGNHGNWPVLTWHWYYSIHHSQSRPDIYNMFKHLNWWETDVCFFILCGPMTEWEEDLAIDNAKR